MSAYCSLPWIHLASHPHGGVTLCCVSDHTNSKNRARDIVDGKDKMLNLNDNTVEEIMNSDYFSTVRMQMLSGVHPEACRRCYIEEDNGVRSKRIEENEKLGFTEDMARAITTATGELTSVNFKFIELRLGNLCNVKCRTCNPASSTSWSGEYQKLQNELSFVTKYDKSINSNWTESDSFWDDLLEHSKDVELIYVNGGEPTLVEKHWKYLERLIEAGLNRQITLWYNINMTNLPDKLVELWSHFNAVQVTCSIDDLRERNEYIRTGTKWSKVIENLDKLQLLPWVQVSVCQTISWLNVFYLEEFHEFMRNRGLHVHMNFVHDPKFLSVGVLPTSITKLLNPAIGPSKLNMLHSQFSKSDDIALLQQGIEYNNWLDQSRSSKFAETFSEWDKKLSDVITKETS